VCPCPPSAPLRCARPLYVSFGVTRGVYRATRLRRTRRERRTPSPARGHGHARVHATHAVPHPQHQDRSGLNEVRREHTRDTPQEAPPKPFRCRLTTLFCAGSILGTLLTAILCIVVCPLDVVCKPRTTPLTVSQRGVKKGALLPNDLLECALVLRLYAMQPGDRRGILGVAHRPIGALSPCRSENQCRSGRDQYDPGPCHR
jgi:hypothetical protein